MSNFVFVVVATHGLVAILTTDENHARVLGGEAFGEDGLRPVTTCRTERRKLAHLVRDSNRLDHATEWLSLEIRVESRHDYSFTSIVARFADKVVKIVTFEELSLVNAYYIRGGKILAVQKHRQRFEFNDLALLTRVADEFVCRSRVSGGRYDDGALPYG